MLRSSFSREKAMEKMRELDNDSDGVFLGVNRVVEEGLFVP